VTCNWVRFPSSKPNIGVRWQYFYRGLRARGFALSSSDDWILVVWRNWTYVWDFQLGRQ